MLLTGEDINLFPLDLFLSGWLTTAITSCLDLIKISRLGIEYSGVPPVSYTHLTLPTTIEV